MFKMHYDGTIKIDWTAPLEFYDEDDFNKHRELSKEAVNETRKDLEDAIREALEEALWPGVVDVTMKKKKLTAEWRDMEEV